MLRSPSIASWYISSYGFAQRTSESLFVAWWKQSTKHRPDSQYFNKNLQTSMTQYINEYIYIYMSQAQWIPLKIHNFLLFKSC